MICHECKEKPASLHFTKIINGEKTEVSLCEKCAQEKGEMFMFNNNSGFTINNLIAGILNLDDTFKDSQQTTFKPRKVIQCEHCLMTIQQFIKIGRFGCANCYDTFSNQLNPILRRLHSGNTTHNGKIPARIGGHLHVIKKIESLKTKLQQLIQNEEFEKAAIIRDEIRSLEAQDVVDETEGGE